MKLNKSLVEMYLIGAFIRFWLATSEYQKVIADRIEVSTPLNSWRRITEGLHMASLNIDPYLGDLLHESPLKMAVYKYLVTECGHYLPMVFIFCDLITASLLYSFATKFIRYLDRYVKKTNGSSIDGSNLTLLPNFVTAVYLFHPYVVLNCVGYTSTVFSNVFIALFLVGLVNKKPLLSSMSLAICLSNDLHLVPLLCPLVIQFSNKERTITKTIIALKMVALFWALLTYSSYHIYKSWNFLENTYGFTLSVPDLRPNIGLSWYFFTEMFEHFRTLFLYAFHINATLLYTIPLSMRFRKEPMLLAASFVSLTTIFKPYPCLGDVGFVLALLCCWKHLFRNTQQTFLVGCCFYTLTALAPVLWHLWIYSGSANANFYFGVTLAFGTGQIFLISDVLFAQVKREYELTHGSTQKIDGKAAMLVLE